MAVSKPSENITLENRRVIFLTVVDAQDRGIPVVKSRIDVAQQFGVTEEDVKAIEREGLEKQWPPL